MKGTIDSKALIDHYLEFIIKPFMATNSRNAFKTCISQVYTYINHSREIRISTQICTNSLFFN